MKLRSSDGHRFETRTDSRGRYQFDKDLIGKSIVKVDIDYKVTVSTPKATSVNRESGFYFLDASAEASTVGLSEGATMVLDIQMHCTSCRGGHSKMPQVDFFDCVELSQSGGNNSRDSLSYVVNILRENAGASVQIVARPTVLNHPGADANCGMNMANICKSYLIKNGIVPSRIEVVDDRSTAPELTERQLQVLSAKPEVGNAAIAGQRVSFRIIENTELLEQ